MDSAITRWQFTHPDEQPTLDYYDEIRDTWRSKGMVSKFLGLFSSQRMYSDWYTALAIEKERKKATWEKFVSTMRVFYKPTDTEAIQVLSTSPTTR